MNTVHKYSNVSWNATGVFGPIYKQRIGSRTRYAVAHFYVFYKLAHELVQRRWTTAQQAVPATNSMPARTLSRFESVTTLTQWPCGVVAAF